MMNIPFVPNQADNVHCLEAAIEMVLRYFWPTRQFTLDQIEQITQKVPGKWSAPPAAMLWLAEHGFEIVEIAGFDNRRFVSEGASYLREEFGEAFARAQEAQGDLDREQSILGQVLERIQSEVRNPTTNDIANFLAEGYVTICHVNSSIVNSTPGYVGHYLVITDISDTAIVVHDPGLPGEANRLIPRRIFQKAWAYPNEKMKNLIGFRLRE
jgi:hypothetical protein